MRRLAFLLWPCAAAVGTIAWSAPAAAAEGEARVFAPSTEWTLHSDAESCWIIRQFGSRDDGVIFRLQAFGPNAGYTAVLWGKPLPQRETGLLEFEYGFEPGGASLSRAGVLERSVGQPVLTFQTNLEFRDPTEADRAGEHSSAAGVAARAATINAFTITFSRGRPLSLQLESMAEPVAQLQACANGLPGKWGLDLAEQQSLSRRAIPVERASWLSGGTYPSEYWRTSQSLFVHLRMMVDANGTPSACVAQAPMTQSGAEALTCQEIIKTARFEPALDASGHAVPSYFTTTVFFYSHRRNGNN